MFRTDSGILRGILAICVIATVTVMGCTQQSGRVVTIWHFWSEPEQRKAFNDIVTLLRKTFPETEITTVELSWSDGRAKLQTAFATGTAPDIVHLGSEWVASFAASGVLEPLERSLLDGVHPSLAPAVTIADTLYAVPWVMNTRALFLHSSLVSRAGVESGVSWNEAEGVLKSTYGASPSLAFGIQSFEPHNVLKRILPLLWSHGSGIARTIPWSATIDEAAVRGLERICRLTRCGVIGPSRSLDDRLRRGELSAWVSGMWNLDVPSINAAYVVQPRWWQDSASAGGSTHGSVIPSGILSADCWSIPRSGTQKETARRIVRTMMGASVASTFCNRLPDAGFPVTVTSTPSTRSTRSSAADRGHSADASFSRNRQAFLVATTHAVTLPTFQRFLDAESIMEEEIMEAVFERKTPRQALEDARLRLHRMGE
ncbi:MAG: ABC transporter substrate-binding protein [Candidatus Kapaibacterium sp.]